MTDEIGFRFPKSERIKQSVEIGNMFKTGRRYSCTGMRLVIRDTDRPYNRVVCIPTRAFENAVRRNRARRIAKEIYRLNRFQLTAGHDMAVVLYPGAYTYQNRKEQMMLLWRRAGLVASGA